MEELSEWLERYIRSSGGLYRANRAGRIEFFSHAGFGWNESTLNGICVGTDSTAFHFIGGLRAAAWSACRKIA